MKVAALIPAFNEAATIADVVRGVAGSVAAVFVVDDGSTDATAERARAAGARVIEQGRNGGKGLAVRRGLAEILDGDFTHVLLLDADLQHLPSEAARLIEAARHGDADLVLGERVFNRGDMPASRYHANRIGSRILSWFVGAPVHDTQCGFRLVRAEALRRVRLNARGYEIETEMLVKLRRRGARIAGVPVSAVYGRQRSKLRPVRDTTRTCLLAVYYQFLERL